MNEQLAMARDNSKQTTRMHQKKNKIENATRKLNGKRTKHDNLKRTKGSFEQTCCANNQSIQKKKLLPGKTVQRLSRTDVPAQR